LQVSSDYTLDLIAAVKKVLVEVANEIYDGHSKNNPHFKKLYESLVPYRSAAYAWQQVAELGFDSFQIRARTRT
jgi:TRAP-type mannitol/chloroaromatic compound transport system substrate-binding protein